MKQLFHVMELLSSNATMGAKAEQPQSLWINHFFAPLLCLSAIMKLMGKSTEVLISCLKNKHSNFHRTGILRNKFDCSM